MTQRLEFIKTGFSLFSSLLIFTIQWVKNWNLVLSEIWSCQDYRVPQSRVTVHLSIDISDLGQALRNFLVAPQWQRNDKPTDGRLLYEASSNQVFSIGGAQPGWCWGWRHSVFNSRRYSWAPSRAGPAQWMVCTLARDGLEREASHPEWGKQHPWTPCFNLWAGEDAPRKEQPFPSWKAEEMRRPHREEEQLSLGKGMKEGRLPIELVLSGIGKARLAHMVV